MLHPLLAAFSDSRGRSVGTREREREREKRQRSVGDIPFLRECTPEETRAILLLPRTMDRLSLPGFGSSAPGRSPVCVRVRRCVRSFLSVGRSVGRPGVFGHCLFVLRRQCVVRIFLEQYTYPGDCASVRPPAEDDSPATSRLLPHPFV